MVKRILMAAAVLVVAGQAGLRLCADEPAGGGQTTRVLRFFSTREGTVAGKPTMLLTVASKYGGSPFDISISNGDANAPKANPPPAVMGVLRSLKKGDLVKVRYTGKTAGQFVLQAADAFTARPGEDDPEAVEFLGFTDANVAGQTCKALLLRKADKDQTAIVPNTKSDQGASAPDGAVIAQAAKLSPGDLADAELSPAGAGTFVYGIYPYQAAKSATFVKAGTIKADPNKTLVTVELKTDSQTLTARIRPTGQDGAADPAMAAKVQALQPNMPVSYKTVTDGGADWLISIVANGITLNGTFSWSGSPKNVTPLHAVLRPTGTNEYSAVYTFTWGGAKKTFAGAVKGDLRNGPVSGTGDGDGRKFIFEGTARDGVITFNDFETTGGKRTPTGPGMLK